MRYRILDSDDYIATEAFTCAYATDIDQQAEEFAEALPLRDSHRSRKIMGSGKPKQLLNCI